MIYDSSEAVTPFFSNNNMPSRCEHYMRIFMLIFPHGIRAGDGTGTSSIANRVCRMSCEWVAAGKMRSHIAYDPYEKTIGIYEKNYYLKIFNIIQS